MLPTPDTITRSCCSGLATSANKLLSLDSCSGPAGVQVAGGRARGIALATSKRSPVLPDVPTFAESGFPGLEAFGFYGVAAPGGTPKAVVNQLNAAFVAAANDRKVRASLVASGYEVMASSPAEYRAFVKNQIELWTPVVKQSNIKVEQ